MKQTKKYSLGFSLVEMAVVLVILGLLLSGLLVPLSAQLDIRNLNDTRQRIININEAIYGFVILNGRLPCPTFEVNPSSTAYGVESSPPCTAEGYLPWKTLGVAATDAWGTPRTSLGDSWNGHWRYRVDSNFVTVPLFSSNILTTPTSTVFASDLSVRDSAGNLLISSSLSAEKPIAILYSTGKDLVPNGHNAGAPDNIFESNITTKDFDDLLIWITRPVLVNRLASADRLP